MKTSDFNFELPEHLIAQYPSAERGQSRLLVMNRKTGLRRHCMVLDLCSVLEGPDFRGPGAKPPLIVLNNTRVRHARLLGISEDGGTKVEFLLLKKLDDFSWRVLARRSKRRKPGSRYVFDDARGTIGEFQGGEGEMILHFDRPVNDDWLDIHGHIPLPPYIRRGDEKADGERYQTVYASHEAGLDIGPGASAAAPTAGLHFTKDLLAELKKAGIESVFVTLHVGLGTFLPVRTENIEDHKMHEETYTISDETACRVEKAKAEGRKILAVGTTSVRTLESAWVENASGTGHLRRGEGSTSIFIYPKGNSDFDKARRSIPAYSFKVVDALFTNFHTPGSTLLMLVSAFAGLDFILESYGEAIKNGYRFFSYGDACLIH